MWIHDEERECKSLTRHNVECMHDTVIAQPHVRCWTRVVAHAKTTHTASEVEKVITHHIDKK
jgi:hypothetical protein